MVIKLASYPRALLPTLALFALAAISFAPLLVERLPISWAPPYDSLTTIWSAQAAVIIAMCLIVAFRARLDRATEPYPGYLNFSLAALAALMVIYHWQTIDADFGNANWQAVLYLDILNRRAVAPHLYRALPYGFVRSLEWLTRDWEFSCVTYRWFFTYWFLWAAYRFTREFHTPFNAFAATLIIPALYPVSIQYYQGQLTDPLSHALFALGLTYIVQDRWLALAGTLALGILAKETAVILVPAYLACYWPKGLSSAWHPTEKWKGLVLRSVFLATICVGVFLAVRLPAGLELNTKSINGAPGLMIGTNLGIGRPLFRIEPYMMRQNFVQPALFIGVFLPFIILQWRRLDRRLRILCLVLTPLVLASNLCFGWMWESRNYVPLLPVLAAMALPFPKGNAETSK